MSFTPAGGGADSSFELVRQSLLQGDGLPFADALTAEQIQQAFDAEGVSFGETERDASETNTTASSTTTASEGLPSDEDDGGIVYTRGVTVWAMLSQALFTDVQRSCRAAVQRVAVYFALLGREVSSTNTGGYCRARAKVTEGVVQRLVEGVALRCEAAVPDEWRWHALRVLMVDGTTFSMADSEENRKEYPQSSSQTEGLGFPVLRAVAVTSLATGMVIALAIGPCLGKETGETSLLRDLYEKLQSGDLVLADRYYGGWFMLALLKLLGIEFVTRLHQHRLADFGSGTRLGKKDHLVAWAKPQKPEWLDQETYDLLPESLDVRETEVTIETPGFRTESLIVVSSLFDHQESPRAEIATLYRRRCTADAGPWNSN